MIIFPLVQDHTWHLIVPCATRGCALIDACFGIALQLSFVFRGNDSSEDYSLVISWDDCQLFFCLVIFHDLIDLTHFWEEYCVSNDVLLGLMPEDTCKSVHNLF